MTKDHESESDEQESRRRTLPASRGKWKPGEGNSCEDPLGAVPRTVCLERERRSRRDRRKAVISFIRSEPISFSLKPLFPGFGHMAITMRPAGRSVFPEFIDCGRRGKAAGQKARNDGAVRGGAFHEEGRRRGLLGWYREILLVPRGWEVFLFSLKKKWRDSVGLQQNIKPTQDRLSHAGEPPRPGAEDPGGMG